tara:strand:- start:34 stop:243 length:210 start_codon:yes stop_codon:yes gene_type:complete
MYGVSSFFGVNEYTDRKALVHYFDKCWWVEMQYKGKKIEMRNMGVHNEMYAESCAENYVLGVLNGKAID